MKLGDIRAMAKKIKTDHELALNLWDTGNVEAQLLATLIIKPKSLSADELDKLTRSTTCAGGRMAELLSDMIRIQGTWVRDATPHWGREVWEFRGDRYTMTRTTTADYAYVGEGRRGSRFKTKDGKPVVIKSPGVSESGTFRLDATEAPKVIVYRWDGPAPEWPLPDNLRYDFTGEGELVRQVGWGFGKRTSRLTGGR